CTQVLDNSSLVAYFSFDNGSLSNAAGLPNFYPHATGQTTIPGHLNQALLFNGTTSSYFQISNVSVVGTVNQPFSISLWIKSAALTGTIIHVSLTSLGLDGWCLPFIGFDASSRISDQLWNGTMAVAAIGPIPSANTWIHVVQTFSTTNGLKLYINGYFYSTTSSTVTQFIASSSSMYMTIGSPRSAAAPGCTITSVLPLNVSYSGSVDELKIYARELTALDVCTLYEYY
ncbi:unnamed protein product, partial [Didymodactylos carnosus]